MKMYEENWTWGELLDRGARILLDAGIEDCREDAKALFLECFGTDQAGLLLHRQDRPQKEQYQQFFQWIARRAQGCPVQYITGVQCFMGFDFLVGPAVLIPRMDTEVLAERVLEEIPKDPDLVLGVDLCTGSGCIALSLSKLGPSNLMMLATDISEGALKIARENARRLAPDCMPQFYQGDLFQALPDQYRGLIDFVVSNPPYVPTAEILRLDKNVKDYEPSQALDGGRDGLSFYRRIAVGAHRFIRPGGSLYLEIGCEQAEAVSRILRHAGFTNIRLFRDLAGRDRVVCANKPNQKG